MKKWINNKHIAFILAFVLAFVSIIVPDVAVKAAESTPKPAPIESVRVNYETEHIVINLSGSAITDDTVLYFGLGTSKKPPSATRYDYVNLFQDEENGPYKASFDISWIAPTKDQYLYLCTDPNADNQTPFMVKLPKQDSLFAKFYGTTEGDSTNCVSKTAITVIDAEDAYGYIVFKKGKSFASGEVVTAGAIQWRKGDNGDWEDVWNSQLKNYNFNLASYSLKGSTIQFRLKPTNSPLITTSHKDTTETKENITGVRASKMLKFKVAAQVAAPKPVVNYLERTIKFPKGVEYSVGDGETFKLDAAKTMKFSELSPTGTFDGDNGMVVYVRKAATKTAKASKVNRIDLNVGVEIDGLTKASSGAATVVTAPAIKIASGSSFTDAQKKNSIVAEYKKPYDNNSGILFTNDTDKVYQVAVFDNSENKVKITTSGSIHVVSQASVQLDGKGKIVWTTVKGQNTRTKNATKVTLSATKYKNMKKPILLYRVQGSNTKTLTSDITVSQLPVKLAQSLIVTGSGVKTSTEPGVLAEIITYSGEPVILDLKASSMTATSVSPKFEYYTNAACTTKDTAKKATGAPVSGKKITSGAGQMKLTPTRTAGVGYVKVIAEGASCVLKVTNKEARKTKANIDVSVQGATKAEAKGTTTSRDINITITSGSTIDTSGVVPVVITLKADSKNASITITSESGVSAAISNKSNDGATVTFTVTTKPIKSDKKLGTIVITPEIGDTNKKVTYTVNLKVSE